MPNGPLRHDRYGPRVKHAVPNTIFSIVGVLGTLGNKFDRKPEERRRPVHKPSDAHKLPAKKKHKKINKLKVRGDTALFARKARLPPARRST
jgi:hypothetical protein